MSKNAIIGIVIGVLVVILLIFVLVLSRSEVEETLPLESPASEEPAKPEKPITGLTDEELLEFEEMFTEAVPSDISTEVFQKLEEKFMLLTTDELRELTVEKIQEMLAEAQEEE